MRRDDDDAVRPPGLMVQREPWGDGWSAARVIEVLEPLVVDARRQRLLQVVEQRIGSITVLMDAPHDPHNGAAVLRSADAFGIQQVHVVPRHEEFLVSSGVAKGTERWVDVVEHPSPEAALARLAEHDFEVVGTHPRGELTPEDLSQLPRLALLFGNEHDGISAALARGARRSVRIPMRGFVESLNVSVSAAVLLSHATRGRPGDLAASERASVYARGLFRSVSRAGEVLDAWRARAQSPAGQ